MMGASAATGVAGGATSGTKWVEEDPARGLGRGLFLQKPVVVFPKGAWSPRLFRSPKDTWGRLVTSAKEILIL